MKIVSFIERPKKNGKLTKITKWYKYNRHLYLADLVLYETLT